MHVTIMIINVRVSSVETCVCNRSGPLDNFIWKLMFKWARFIALPDWHIHVFSPVTKFRILLQSLKFMGCLKWSSYLDGFEDESCNYY